MSRMTMPSRASPDTTACSAWDSRLLGLPPYTSSTTGAWTLTLARRRLPFIPFIASSNATPSESGEGLGPAASSARASLRRSSIRYSAAVDPGHEVSRSRHLQ